MGDAPTVPKLLTQEQIDKISGGADCDADTWIDISGRLIEAYENLVDFTSHVIERVAGE